MCRILFAVGDGDEIRELLDVLVLSSRNDPYKAKRHRGNQHRDGWGYILLKDGIAEHYRSMTPIFQDKAVKRLKERLSGFSVLMAHSRAASQGNKNLFNVQPFGFSSRKGFSFWFLHNGDLNKKEIVDMAELEREKVENASDSFTTAVYLCRFLEGSDEENLLAVFRELKKTTNTALNTATLIINPQEEVKAFITAYMTEKASLEHDYYRLLTLRKGNIFAVVSSTFELYSGETFRGVENGEAFYVDVSFEKENFEVKKSKI
ncbi:class II glutamine amidotransferase [Thermococcus sp.]